MSSVYILIPVSLLCYFGFFQTTRNAWKKGSEKILVHGDRVPDSIIVTNLQITGIVVLGFLTAILRKPAQMSFLSFPSNADRLLVPVTFLLIIVVFIMSWIAAVRKIKQTPIINYPVNSNYRTITNYFLYRFLFLIAYEFFFRGVLLFDIAILAGITISTIVNIVLYVIIHWFDDRQTIIGAVPFGIVLCWLSWKTQSIWPAVILHLVLALTYEIKVISHLFHSPKKSIT
ncbi:MAG: CPBP family intramembrane glutamic endopeptidase [Bacteroidota bacterium]